MRFLKPLLSESNLEPDCAHQLDAIALSDNTLAQGEIESHLTVREVVLEMHVPQRAGRETANVRQGEIVSADEADRARRHKSSHNALGTGETILGVGSLQELVQQKEERRAVVQQGVDLSQSGDFGVEARASLVEWVVHPDARADLQRRETEAPGPH